MISRALGASSGTQLNQREKEQIEKEQTNF